MLQKTYSASILVFLSLLIITQPQINRTMQTIQSTIIILTMNVRNFNANQQIRFKKWVVSSLPSYSIDETNVDIISFKQGSLIIDLTIQFSIDINAVQLSNQLSSNGITSGYYGLEVVSITSNATILETNGTQSQNTTNNNITNGTYHLQNISKTSSSSALSIQVILSIAIIGIISVSLFVIYIIYRLRKNQNEENKQQKNKQKQNQQKSGSQSASHINKVQLIQHQNNPQNKLNDIIVCYIKN